MKEYYIYAHICKETRKVLYIGKGSVYSNKYTERAYDFRKRKYTLNDVEVIILPMRYSDESLAYEVEELITQHYKVLGECEYNTYVGHKPPKDYGIGENNSMYGRHHSIEAKEKMSKTKKENGILLGDKNPMYGKNHTDESKQKMRKNRTQHKVYCYDTNSYYEGTGEAAERLGMNRGAISNCCRRGTLGFSKILNKKVRLEYRDED